MARRGRVKLQFIMDRAERKRTLEKRLPVLLKKTREFAVLCDVLASLVVYLPGEDQPVIWPSPEGAVDALRRYNEVGDSKRFKNTLNTTEFLHKMKDKVSVKLSNVQRERRDEEINLVLADSLSGRRKSFDDLPIDIFTSVGTRVEDKLQAVKARLQELGSATAPALLPLHPPSPMDVPIVDPLAMVQPRHGILPTTEEMNALFVQAGIFSPRLPNPSSL